MQPVNTTSDTTTLLKILYIFLCFLFFREVSDLRSDLEYSKRTKGIHSCILISEGKVYITKISKG